MSLTITLTGTGSAQLVPVFGCDCAACRRARLQETYRRRPCSAVVKFNDAVTLLDAGIPHLMDDWAAGSFQQFLLTHYHMDHVQGLFPLRWGVGATIPVYGPPDEAGCDDLFKHPGILDFSHTVDPFVMFELQGMRVTPPAAQPFETDLRVFTGIGPQPRGLAFRYRRTAGKNGEVPAQQPAAGDDYRLQP